MAGERSEIEEICLRPEDFPGAAVTSVKRQHCFFHEGDPFDGRAYLILSGEAEVRIDGFDGSQTLLYRLGAGDLFGALGFLAQHARMETVTMATHGEVLRISQPVWNRSQESPKFQQKLFQAVLRRCMATHDVVRRLGQSKVKHRLGMYLLNLPEWREAKVDVLVHRLPTHAMLASMLNCTRERLTRVINELADTGVLSKADGSNVVSISRRNLEKVLRLDH